MGTLAWLILALGLLAVFPAVRFGRRAWRFRALPTVRAVLIGQIAGLASIVTWCLLAPRPDLGGAGWAALGLAALALPLAVGDAIQSRGHARAASIALAAGAALVTAAAAVLTVPPTLTAATIAGHTIPVTEKTLANGAQLAVRISPTASGFQARDAHLFVPPGWLRDPSTPRPVVEMMMGQPGKPTLGATLDALHSLGAERLADAPFVLVVDQLGAIDRNPPCSDTSAGKLDTYLSQDVPAWVRANLPVRDNRDDWAIAGYSHGGECAAYLGATHPEVWASVIDISGPDKPGEYRPALTRDRYYGGSQDAYEATWPVNILAATRYPETMTGIFVAGEADPHFRQQVEDTATAAENAGWKVTYWAVPGEGHSGPTLTKGLATAYNQLIPRWVDAGAIARSDRMLCSPAQTPQACGLTQVGAVAGLLTMLNLSALAVFLSAQLILFFRRARRTAAVEVE